jgi:hypothetical protein
MPDNDSLAGIHFSVLERVRNADPAGDITLVFRGGDGSPVGRYERWVVADVPKQRWVYLDLIRLGYLRGYTNHLGQLVVSLTSRAQGRALPRAA